MIAQSASPSKTAPENSDTEEDEELLLDAKPAPPPQKQADDRRRALPTPARSVSPANIHPQRARGRIIGNTFPLLDFKKNIAQGDVVSKAVEDLALVITEIVMRPFSSRRTDELLECMRAFREVALKASHDLI
jgi:ATP-dependent DNA helicase 2 subunit 2